MDSKRVLDIFGSVVGLVVTAPAVAAGVVASAVAHRANPIMKVERLGKDREIFQMFKIRSMNNNTDEKGELLPDEQRRTTVGQILRFTSIDEIPQLVNILKGNMSFIGPRPRSPYGDHTEFVPAEYADLFKVKPGLSGAWQVSVIGAKEQGGALERARVDAEYARSSPSVMRDLKLIAKSFGSFVRGHDGTYLDINNLNIQTHEVAPPGKAQRRTVDEETGPLGIPPTADAT